MPEIERLLASESPDALPLIDRRALLEALAWLQRALENRGRSLGQPVADDLALRLLAGWVSDSCADRRQRGLPPIRHLGWFIPRIRSEARRNQDANRRRELAPAVRTLRRLLAIDVARRPDHPNPRPAEKQLLTAAARQDVEGLLLDPDLATVALELLQRPRRGSGARYTGP